MPTGRLTPSVNRLLAALPPEAYRRLLPDLEPVELTTGEAVDLERAHVVFPCRGIVSLNYQLTDGASLAVALIGAEGLVGVSAFMDGAASSSQSIVQTPGQGFRLSAAVVRRELRVGGQLQSLALRFIQALITQMAQTAVCNRHHNLDQQICRWLLLSLDRLEDNEICMTQELIAQLLGVRREGVTSAAGKLQEAAVITYARGRIVVHDRAALEARVCECFAVVSGEYLRLLPPLTNFRRHLQVIHDP